MTTEVSSTPRLSSGIGGLIHYRVEVRSEPVEVNSGGTLGGGGDCRAWHEPSWGNGSELRDRHAVASDDERLTSLDLSEHGRGVVTQLSLGNGSRHVSQRS